MQPQPTTPSPSWANPEAPSRPDAPERHRASVPLGGVPPTPVVDQPRSERRELLVAAVLMVASVGVALATLMSWHDYGRGLDPRENGWELADGSFGRGWVAIVLAVVLATAGVLLVTGRHRAGRRWARIGAIGLVVLSALEWAFGADGARTGPGLGLWFLFACGVILVVLLGTVLPPEPARSVEP